MKKNKKKGLEPTLLILKIVKVSAEILYTIIKTFLN